MSRVKTGDQKSGENYKELKRFINRFRQKLSIKSAAEGHEVSNIDRLFGTQQAEQRAQELDFDYQQFVGAVKRQEVEGLALSQKDIEKQLQQSKLQNQKKIRVSAVKPRILKPRRES